MRRPGAALTFHARAEDSPAGWLLQKARAYANKPAAVEALSESPRQWLRVSLTTKAKARTSRAFAFKALEGELVRLQAQRERQNDAAAAVVAVYPFTGAIGVDIGD